MRRAFFQNIDLNVTGFIVFKIFNNTFNLAFSSWRKINTTVDTVFQEALKIIAVIVNTI